MANKAKNNKLKRKRGKKFIFKGDTAITNATPTAVAEAVNPFEARSAGRKAFKDKAKVCHIMLSDIDHNLCLFVLLAC